MPDVSTPAAQLAAQSFPTPVALAPFDRWTYDDAVREMKAATDRIGDYLIKKEYCVNKDHFQSGKEWIGPGDAVANPKIEEQFAPEDAIGEVLANVANAFSEPQITFVPLIPVPEGEKVPVTTQRIMDEAQNLLTRWWDSTQMQRLLQDRLKTAAWATRAALRLWIPGRFLLQNQDRSVVFRATNSFEEALTFIRVSAPLPEHAMVLCDPQTDDKVAVFLDEEVEFTGTERNVYKRAELVYLDPDRTRDADADTIIRIVYSDPIRPIRKATLSLGGRLTVTEMTADAIITEPVLRTQRQVNFHSTILTRLTETAGFRERYTTNAEPHGERYPYIEGTDLRDPSAYVVREESTGLLWEIIPLPRSLGANTTTELVGLPQYDDAGNKKGYATPGVIFADPADPKPYIEAREASRRCILRMCAQGHLGGISNAESSGIAYEQARAVFEKDLTKRKVSEEGMLRDLLTTVLAYIEDITDQHGYFTDSIRVVVDQHVNPGPRSPDLVRLDMEAYEGGGMSLETLLAKLGIEDTEAELIRIRTSPAYVLKVFEQVTTAAGDLFSADSLKQLMVQLGLPAATVNVLQKAPDPPAKTAPTTP